MNNEYTFLNFSVGNTLNIESYKPHLKGYFLALQCLRVESFLETSIFGNNFCSSFFFMLRSFPLYITQFVYTFSFGVISSLRLL